MSIPVKRSYLTEYAAEGSYTIDDLQKTAEKLHTAIQSRLNNHFERAYLKSGANHWLIEQRDGVWFAFTAYDLEKEMREADIKFEADQLMAVAYASLTQFQSMKEMTIEVPGRMARRLDNPFFFPIFVQYPEDWQRGEHHVFQRFQRLVWRNQLTPAEALDYWVSHRTSTASWAGKRDVSPEAVRKNIRQAREKLMDEDRGASHTTHKLRPVSVEDIPDGKPHDEDKDVFYIPTEEAIDDPV